MKIDFSQKLLDFQGKQIEVTGLNKDVILATLGNVSSGALLVVLEKDRNEGGKARYERWQLAGKIIKADGLVELEAEEVTVIKERIGLMYGPIIIGPAYDLLEGKD